MNNKWPLAVAVTFGLASLLLMNLSGKRSEGRDGAGVRMKSVVYARTDIPIGTELRRELLTVKAVPESYVPAQAVLEEGVKMVLGRKTSARIERDRLLSYVDVAGESQGGFTRVIPSGEGAYTVTIGRGIKPGLIQPGDHIDLMSTMPLSKSLDEGGSGSASWKRGSDMVNVVLLQNVTVLAVGDTYGKSSRGEMGGGADLTLALTLQEAQILMYASQNGELGAMLRPENSIDVKQRADLRRISQLDLEQIIGTLDLKRNQRTVEVQRGGRTTAYSIDAAAPAASSETDVRTKK